MRRAAFRAEGYAEAHASRPAVPGRRVPGVLAGMRVNREVQSHIVACCILRVTGSLELLGWLIVAAGFLRG